MEPMQISTRQDQALRSIAQAIRDNPDTGGGVQLRLFLWSLFNMHHLVNLWTMVSRLDRPHSQWVAEVLNAALVGNLKESDIKKALVLAGEMERWDQSQSSPEMLDKINEAQMAMESLTRTTVPNRVHTELVQLLRAFDNVRKAIQDSNHQNHQSSETGG